MADRKEDYYWDLGNERVKVVWYVIPFTTKISVVILLTVCHTFVILSVVRIRCWIKKWSPIDILVYSHHLFAWYSNWYCSKKLLLGYLRERVKTNSFSIGKSFGISGVCCLDRFLNKGAPFCGHCALLSKNVFCFIYFFPKINVTFPFVMNFCLFDFGPSVHCITFWKHSWN